MRIVYVIPRMSGEGGVQRVIAMKANYWVQQHQAEVHLVTHDPTPSFYTLHSHVRLHYMKLQGNRLGYFIQYIKQVKGLIQQIQPDVVMVCDGFKGFFLPYFIRKIPCVFESHGSYYNRVFQPNQSWVKDMQYRIELAVKRHIAKRFSRFVVLSEASASEWNLPNSTVIPNPNWVTKEAVQSYQPTPIALVVARHSYEKGIDRVLAIWKQFTGQHPDWQLHIYGSGDATDHQLLASKLGITPSVRFFEPVHQMEAVYQKAGMFLMTSRFEGLPMSMIEALAFGIPCVAYDCPVGPRSLLQGKNGFLVQDKDDATFLARMNAIASNNYAKAEMSNAARESVQQFELSIVMRRWFDLLSELRVR
ncbi:glycosyltransferase [Flavobacterium sp. N1719]|uniref:glycosyltransferase n=1 Tax=Flavobacterium sp. N1719 TaxID=2885633 RepID=UPI0022214687|nr:glycosyltransferase [Flavobacterium sp. N1719]